MAFRELSIPEHFDPDRVGEVWRVPYLARAEKAKRWASEQDITAAEQDGFRIGLLLVDMQNTFCIPGFELFVGGRSGVGAVDDAQRLCRFLYRNLGTITRVLPTLDTHQATAVFHPMHLIDGDGHHPEPFTGVTLEDAQAGRWRFNPTVAAGLGIDPDYGQRHFVNYLRRLRAGGRFDLTVWPYHSMLGGIGHALVAAVEEAVFFHGVARASQPAFHIKGNRPLTEHYSVLGPEVTVGPGGEAIAEKDAALVGELLDFDALVVAGQAKSHCVTWSVTDLLGEIEARDPRLAERVYLLEDCTSPVVIPGVIDFTEQADTAFRRFAAAGMHVVRSTEPLASWPGMRQR